MSWEFILSTKWKKTLVSQLKKNSDFSSEKCKILKYQPSKLPWVWSRRRPGIKWVDLISMWCWDKKSCKYLICYRNAKWFVYIVVDKRRHQAELSIFGAFKDGWCDCLLICTHLVFLSSSVFDFGNENKKSLWTVKAL